MATAQAMKLCPDLLLIPPNMEKYRIASRQIMEIYRDYTDLVEPLSLDEAYLDVSDSPHCKGSATLIAQEIRRRIFETVGITASAGVAPNKFVAKIASDWNKPDGLFLVRPEEVDAFVAALPVKKLFGVGKVTAAKLTRPGRANLRRPARLEHAGAAAAFRFLRRAPARPVPRHRQPRRQSGSASASRSAPRKPIRPTCRTCRPAWPCCPS
jgi:nucleotidyltransferase/DNA polymerase involved in DNA repair